ncbi:MAG: M24 family metallopeptidase [Paracoccaceae bacterium]
MSETELWFSRAEYAERLAKTRAAMDAAGIDVLFTSDPSNMAWLTGYDGWSFYVHQGVIVGPAGDPVFWGRKMDAAGALRRCYMSSDDIVAYSDDYVMAPPAHAMQHLAELLRTRGWAALRLGTEHENYYYSAKAHAVLSEELGRAPFDATALVNWCRAVKSPAEIRLMRRAARIGERIHDRVREIMAPGIRGNEVAAEIYRTAILGAEDADGPFGGDYPAIAPLMPAGKDASAAHLSWSDKAFVSGIATFFEVSGCVGRYHAPLCRTVFLGAPDAEIRRAEAAVCEAIPDCLSAARAGNAAGDVARAFEAVLARHGIPRHGRCGYPVGLSYPPDWGERTFSLRPSDETELRPGMTIHFMPGIWSEDWGLEITETLLIRETGPAEALADYPRALFVKG